MIRIKPHNNPFNFARIINMESIMTDIYIVELALSYPLHVKPGQYIKASFDNINIRSYSVFEQKTPTSLRLLIKTNKSKSNINQIIALIKTKHFCYVGGAYGHCSPDTNIQETMWVVQGSAIAPVNCILTKLSEFPKNKMYTLLWFVDQTKASALVELITNLSITTVADIKIHLFEPVSTSSLMQLSNYISNLEIPDYRVGFTLFGSHEFIFSCKNIIAEKGYNNIKFD